MLPDLTLKEIRWHRFGCCSIGEKKRKRKKSGVHWLSHFKFKCVKPCCLNVLSPASYGTNSFYASLSHSPWLYSTCPLLGLPTSKWDRYKATAYDIFWNVQMRYEYFYTIPSIVGFKVRWMKLRGALVPIRFTLCNSCTGFWCSFVHWTISWHSGIHRPGSYWSASFLEICD